MNQIKLSRIIAHGLIALLICALLASCKPKEKEIVPVNTGSSGPTQVALVEVSSAGSASIDVSWLPATDSTTPASAMRYQVHASTALIYVPDSATLKAEGTGILSARLTGLQAATQYTIILVAINAAGNSTASTPLTVTTSSLNSETITGVVVATPTEVQIATVSDNQVTLTADAAAPEVGQFIASTLGDGFLREVTSVSTVAGQTVVQTQPASLNQVVNNVEISSAFNMTSVPAEAAPVQAGIIVKPSTTPKGAAEWQWPQTNFRMSSEPVKRNPANKQSALQMGLVTGAGNMDVSTQVSKKVGSWATFIGPHTIGILTNTKGAVELKVDVTNGTGIPIAICKVEVVSSDVPSLITVSSMTPTATKIVDGYTAIQNATQLIAVDATGVAPRAKPYLVELRAYIDEAHNNCRDRSLLSSWWWKERLDIVIDVAVLSTPNFPQAETKPLKFTGTGDFSVNNDVTYTFDPRLEVNVTMPKNLVGFPTLKYARLEAKVYADLKQKLTVSATGAGTIDMTHMLLNPTRKFIKVYMAGTVPIVMSGELGFDIRVKGNVTGSLIATEELTFIFEDISYGVIYENGAWRTTKSISPDYALKLAGNGDAQAHLTVSLLPKLYIKFYDAASGRLVVSPYLQVDAGIHGQVLADVTPSGITTDADYWLTQGQISGGVDAYLMADLTIIDKTFLKWPPNANIDDYTSYKLLELLPNKPIVGLPILTATYDAATKHPTDSRAYLIKGQAVNVPNPFKSLFSKKDTFLPFENWTQPKVIALNNTGYTFVPSPAGSDPGDVWINFTSPGSYTVRLGGNSSMGGWARQVAEVVVAVTDSNSNSIIDQWENKYGLTGTGAAIAAADPDTDGLTNLQEFQQGSNPIVADAPPANAPSQTAVITQVLDDFGTSVGPLAQNSITDDTTPGLSGTLSAALTATQRLVVYNGSAILGSATVSGTTWSFTPTALAAGTYSFSAAVVSVDGIKGAVSGAWNLTISATCPAGQVLQNGQCVTPTPAGNLAGDQFDGTSLQSAYWTSAGAGAINVSGGVANFACRAYASTSGKYTLSGDQIIIESRMVGTGSMRDTVIALYDVSSGDTIRVGDTNYWSMGLYTLGTGAFSSTQAGNGTSVNVYKEYRMTVNGTTLTVERGDTLANITESRTVTLASSIAGKTFYLLIGTGGPDYCPGSFDWINVSVGAAPPTNTFSISGSAGLQGVTMTLSGANSGGATTGANGNYTFGNLANGSYTVAPALSGYSFTPSSLVITVNGANITAANFTATSQSGTLYSITGTVTSSGYALPGVTMTLSGASSGAYTTVDTGMYAFALLPNGSYTVTPTLSGYSFTPASSPITISGANIMGANFTATAAADTTKPIVSGFSVTPGSLTVGSPFTISYTVSDSGGSGLWQAQLWRAPDVGGVPGTWTKITTTPLSGNGPVSGSFTDAPTSGTYWYGVHGVDTAINVGVESNSAKVVVNPKVTVWAF